MKVISIAEAPGITPRADMIAEIEKGDNLYRVSFSIWDDHKPVFSQINGWNGGVSVFVDRIERQDEDDEERWVCIEGLNYQRLETEFEPLIEEHLEYEYYGNRYEPILEAI